MDLITIDAVAALNPCSDRFNNFTDNNPGFSDTVESFLSLDNITYSDKVWVMTKFMTKKQKILWAVACAYSVLVLFEMRRPNNNAPRKVLEFLSTIKNVDSLTEIQLVELRNLRNAAAAAATYAATYADADAAAAATYAADAATYADAAAATYAADAAADAADAKQNQQDLNLLLMIEVINAN
jgi:hypothetical protein